MTKAGDKILEGAREMLAYVKGEPVEVRVTTPADVDVKAIRARMGLSQEEFARRFGFELATLRNWEQKRRCPEASARILLMVIEQEPAAVLRALRTLSTPKTAKLGAPKAAKLRTRSAPPAAPRKTRKHA